MRSWQHLLISLPVAVAGVVVFDPPAPVLVGGYATALGVLVDLDHFLVARLNAGDWGGVRHCLHNPTDVLFDQAAIFGEGEVWPLERLLSHAVLGGIVVGAWLVVAPAVAVVSALVLYAHVLSDLLWDVARHGEYLRRAAAYRQRRAE